jgi:peptidoglycan/xylan/chitin deacetylase (PgdA/CDA1 family)
MTFERVFIIAAAVVLATGGARLASAETPGAEASPPAQCWTQEALAGTPKELKATRSGPRLDLRALKQEPLPAPVPIAEDLRGSIRSVELPPGQKLIALTFDLCESDGDHAGYDGRVVDLLRAEGVKATFFAGGKWLESHPERAQQLIADANFEIGAHGLRHRDLTRATDKTMAEEIGLTEAAFARARKALEARACVTDLATANVPQDRITLMRFPYGRCNAKALAAVAAAGQLAVQWDVVTGDPDPHVTAKGIANTILTHAHPGAIVVAHANGRGRNTAAALKIALPKLKEEGYSFVTVSELLAAGKPVIAATCYLDRPGDAARVAHAKPRAKSNDIWSLLRKR